MKNCEHFSDRDVDRFWSKFSREDKEPCWPWPMSKFPDGYGQFMVKHHPYRAHRVAWELTNGSIPDGILVCHKCDNPICCNPNHLFLGTVADNHEDRGRKGRTASGDRHGFRKNPSKVPRGEANGNSILTDDEVRLIKKMKSEGAKNIEIAKATGRSESIISRIVLGKSWRHISCQ